MPLFGGGAYDVAKEREAVPFDEQLQALEEGVKAGQVRGGVGGYVGIKSYYYTQGEVGDEKLCSFSRRAQ